MDADALLRFTLSSLREVVTRMGGEEELRHRLARRLEEISAPQEPLQPQRRHRLAQRITDLKRSKELAKNNALLASDPELRAEGEKLFVALGQQLVDATAELNALSAAPIQPAASKEQIVERAVAIFRELQGLALDRANRLEAYQLFAKLGIRIGLEF